MKSFGNDVTVAALAFLLYGAVGQLFSSPSAIFPSQYINSSSFLNWFGFPVQVFRALMATVVAVFIIRSLRASEIESQRQIAELREMQMAERMAYEEARAELLHRTVKAQESERQRIAQELHDGTGQTLTGLGMGLRALAENIGSDPQRAIQQTQQLEKLTTNGVEELQRMVSGLHPPQLEDLGLVAALRWYADEISRHSNLKIIVNGSGDDQSLPQEVRTVFFRIAQEAVTNTLRHAEASQVLLNFECNEHSCFLRVEDDGCGFQVEKTLKDTTKPHWGLLGMQERAALIQGNLVVESSPGFGTLVMVEWLRSNADD
jgi:signal transduction histidine kinase